MTAFNPGFRLSKIDIAVIGVSIIAAAVLYRHSALLSFLVLFVVAPFFLFCNITRMSRGPELLWAGVFLIVVSLSLELGVPGFKSAIGLSATTTIILVALELRKPSYHGVFWQKLNPNLERWFANKYQSGKS